MKILKRMGSLLLCTLLLLALTASALADEQSYTYRITFHAGNQGKFVSDALQVRGSGYSVKRTEESIIISGLHLGDRVIWDNDAVELLQDSRYYIRGVRLSGRDNSTVDAASFSVQGDRDYVVAYGIRAETVSYTIQYQDADGKELHKSRTMQGNVGDKPVVAALYIEGYVPQAYNLTGTLKADESKNVFTFVYRALKTRQSGGGNAHNTNQPDNNTNNTGNGAAAGNGNGTNAGTNNGTDNTAGANNENNPANGQTQAGDQTQTGDQGEETGTEEIPEIVDIDDEQTPLASGRAAEIDNEANRVGLMLPAVAVISVLAVVCLTIWWRISDKKKKKK